MRLFRGNEHPLRHSLWLAGSWTALFVIIIVVAQASARLTGKSHQLEMGGDFVSAYAAGTLVRQGNASVVYDPQSLGQLEQQIVRDADLEPLPFYGQYLNPPFFAAFLASFSLVPYREAAMLWLGFHLLCLASAIVLLCRTLLPHGTAGAPSAAASRVSTVQANSYGGRGSHGRDARATGQLRRGTAVPATRLSSSKSVPPALSEGYSSQSNLLQLWSTWALVPLLVLISMPCIQALCHLQNTCLSLLLLCGVVCLWRCAPTNTFASVGAGILAGLLAYKPQLACLIAIAQVLTLGWRAFLGLCITGAALLAFTFLKLPGTIGAYLHQLPSAVQQIQNRPEYNWGRQITPGGFWRLLIQGHSGGPALPVVTILSYVTTVLVAAGLILCLRAYFKNRDEPYSLDRLIAVTIASMPLLMPYYMDYDLLLMAIPAVLLACEWIQSKPAGIDRLLPWAWGALFLALYVNPGISAHSRLNLTAPLLFLVDVLLMVRCVRRAGTARRARNWRAVPALHLPAAQSV